MNFKPHSFTVKYTGVARELITDCRIYPAFDPAKIKIEPIGRVYKGLWDTGATNTSITRKVADECGLKPIGQIQCHTAAGTIFTDTYIINIKLLNEVGLPGIRVSEAKLTNGIDVLIGMDIIAHGDFAITGHDGKTVFSFRLPSQQEIDFCEASQAGQTNNQKISGSALCPCGSGKKFKNCCRNKKQSL